MGIAVAHTSSPLLPLDQQMVTLDLAGRRLLARIVACSEDGRLSVVVFDVVRAVRDALERFAPVNVEWVKVGLCRASFTPSRVEDAAGPRAPMLLVHGELGSIESVQRRDNFRVRLALTMELLLLKGALDRPPSTVLAEPVWWLGRSVNMSAEGVCVELGHELYRGDVLSVRLHTEARVLEADACALGPRPTSGGLRQYGLQLIQIPRADQRVLAMLINQEERRGLAYRVGRWE